MDSFEFNKIAGAVLGTALGIMVIGTLAEIIYEPPHAEEPGYVIAVAEPGTGDEGGSGGAAADVPPIAVRLQTASVEDGMDSTKKCQACHTFDKGGATKVGPNLWDVIGHNVIHQEGFDYSEAMEEKGKDGMTWTFDNLDEFLTNPKGFIPGTAMSFAGLKKPDERANVIAYLRTLSDNPVPLPAATAATEPADAPATGGEAPAPAPAPDAHADAPAPAPAEAPAPQAEAPAPAPAPVETPAPAPAPAP